MTSDGATRPDPTEGAGHTPHSDQKPNLKLLLGALGVVFGDIGTSPLYAIRECVSGPEGMGAAPANIMGVLSLVFWALAFVVALKYLVFVVRADNRGEGGVLALLALVLPKDEGHRRRRDLVATFLGLAGAALLLGDGMITPAISVLSAVEGLEVTGGHLGALVLPITCAILVLLFLVQRRGTALVGAFFGPAMLIWFGTLTITGLPWIFRQPQILKALNPYYAFTFMMHGGMHAFLLLGAVVLCVTGGEALYADLGHFGASAIRRTWFFFVWPALLINYFGQGALLLQHPEQATQPFYALVDGWAIYPLIGVATVATVVASQALISGVFSLARQAIHMGWAPRLTVQHTSATVEGQIYVPEMNAILMVACLALVLQFRTSAGLAAAYGIAVTGTMVITTMLFFLACRRVWHWPLLPSLALCCLFGVVDMAFLLANVRKIGEGGWVPILIAALAVAVMTTWRNGRGLLEKYVESSTLPLPLFIEDVKLSNPHRVAGTAIFLSPVRRGTPNALLHHFKHNKVLHRRVIILSIASDDVPRVAHADRVRSKDFGQGFIGVVAHFGFMESPDVSEILARLRDQGLVVNIETTSFFLGRETLVRAKEKSSMPAWRFKLFRFLSRNSSTPTDFFGLPPNRVIEVGTQLVM
ncbi:MAG: potassium transporter Kup [Deltaproteobacteria bacterium]|nr:potassium transporter Kup [Deltaproteobacteria bacterium]